MAAAQVVERSITNNSPSQDSNHPDDLFQSRYNCDCHIHHLSFEFDGDQTKYLRFRANFRDQVECKSKGSNRELQWATKWISVGPQGVRAQIWAKCYDSPSLEIVCYRWAKDKT